ncbi:hypothetical protein MIC448_260024 [Microbacterium sp. C448]|uniref:hypothetical protein n=1 Tax=Microbacterium TaxID=33882 RepID=UPI0003DE0C82|nr:MULTISPECIES: hypothetical protein [Microbacterium]CDK00526.1 hypothetical protein MIC448_260024 [Microbacterium sp. C448]
MTTDTALWLIVFNVALWALVTILSLLVAYLVIRLAVSHALRSHTRWIDRGKP